MKSDLVYEAMRHLIDEVIYVNNEAREITFVSPSVEHVLGYTVEEFMALLTPQLIHPDDLADAARTAVTMRAEPGASYRTTLRIRHARGHFVWCEVVGRNLLHEDIRGIVSTLRDVTERRNLEQELQRLAHHDELSQLPNRRGFLAELERCLRSDGDPKLGLLMIDLDGFKAVNDTLGHQAGDALLEQCAGRMAAALRPGDMAGRLGGDEFAVLCRRVEDAAVLRGIGERIRRAASGEYPLDAGSCTIGLSIGGALARPQDSSGELIRSADDALYRAKDLGRGRTELAQRPPLDSG